MALTNNKKVCLKNYHCMNIIQIIIAPNAESKFQGSKYLGKPKNHLNKTFGFGGHVKKGP